MYDNSDLHNQVPVRCYYALKYEVLPSFELPYTIKYGIVKIPAGKLRLKVVEAEDRLMHLRMKMQIVVYHVAPVTMGPMLRAYFEEAGDNLTNVEFSADSLEATNSRILNAYMNMFYKIPGMKRLGKRITPKYYFGDSLVYDGSLFDEEKMIQYWNQHSFKFIFNDLHRRLREQLERERYLQA